MKKRLLFLSLLCFEQSYGASKEQKNKKKRNEAAARKIQEEQELLISERKRQEPPFLMETIPNKTTNQPQFTYSKADIKTISAGCRAFSFEAIKDNFNKNYSLLTAGNHHPMRVEEQPKFRGPDQSPALTLTKAVKQFKEAEEKLKELETIRKQMEEIIQKAATASEDTYRKDSLPPIQLPPFEQSLEQAKKELELEWANQPQNHNPTWTLEEVDSWLATFNK